MSVVGHIEDLTCHLEAFLAFALHREQGRIEHHDEEGFRHTPQLPDKLGALFPIELLVAEAPLNTAARLGDEVDGRVPMFSSLVYLRLMIKALYE